MNANVVRTQEGWALIDDEGGTAGSWLTKIEAVHEGLERIVDGQHTHLDNRPVSRHEAIRALAGPPHNDQRFQVFPYTSKESR